MRVRARFIIGAGLIVAAVAYLIVAAIQSTSEYYLTVDEVAARQPALQGQTLRVAGQVKAGTIQWDPAKLRLKFGMVAIPDPSKGKLSPVAASDHAMFTVICTGEPKPDMFAPGRDVIVEGRLGAGGVVNATQVMTSCPSKYRPKKGG
jgi:cytochrome c-type biogenesis protein CcmE